MYQDALGVFSAGQDLSQAAATYDSTAIDFAQLGTIRPFGPGAELEAIIEVDEGFDSAGAATIQFQLVEASDTTLDADVVVLRQTIAIDATAATGPLVQGYKINLAVPIETIGQRYLGLNYVIATAATTAGTVNAWLTNRNIGVVQTAKAGWPANSGF